MGATLDALHALQSIERRLNHIHAQADTKKRQLARQQRALRQHDEALEQKRQAQKSLQMEIDRIELDIKARDNMLSKHREALNQARTNKEYASILTTINTEKADNTKLENRQLELMGDLDAARAATEASQKERALIVERIAQAERNLHQFLADQEAEIKQLEAEREETASRVSPEVLATFRRVAERNEGEAMAPVEVINAKRGEYGCRGCNMSLQLQQIVGLQAGEIQVCGSCGRILYMETAGTSQSTRS